MTNKTCFIIQPFSEPYNKRFENIYKPAIECVGLIPYRAGGPSAEIITDDIEDGIRNAHICFADITENNPNVWYEVGFAYACYKRVVMVCNKAARGDKRLPFDISVKNVIPYNDLVDSYEINSSKFSQEIIKQARERVKKADSDNRAITQQSQNDDNFTAFDGEVLMVIYRHYSVKRNSPIVRGAIMSQFPFARRKALDSIDKLELYRYIKMIPASESAEGVVGYHPTEKGRQLYHGNNRD